jgi:hypothetical protein
MSVHIVDDEQRSDRRVTPMRPSGSGLAGTSASLALLDDVPRHRLRRAALYLPLPGQERGPFYYSDRLLVIHQPVPNIGEALNEAVNFRRKVIGNPDGDYQQDQPQHRRKHGDHATQGVSIAVP